MISNPRPGQRVQVWYNAKAAPHMPYHGKFGTVQLVSRGKPRNHLIQMDDGAVIGVPCGNIRPENPKP